MKFSREFIDKVRDANSIVDVVSRQVALKKSGGQYLGLCPFPDHKEKTPSFSVSESKQLYYCFGCKKAGNIFNFVEAIMGMNFPEAVEWLARQARIPIPEGTHADNQFRKSEDHEKRTLLAINDFATKYFSDELARSHSSDEIKDYLKARGISANTVKSFRLGYSLNHWDKLSSLMASHQIPLPKAESLGLIRHRKEGQEGYYDIFRHRLMFPILGLDGSCLGFGGRIIGEGEPKYLNSPESAVFHKGKIFYGLYESAKYIRAQDQVIVVEGYMDMLALFQAGIRNVVAPLGTALTSDQARLLKRFTRNVVMLFDGDSAGQMAAERSLPILLKEGLLPVGVTLPSDMDPDDFVQKYGASELQEKEYPRRPSYLF